MSDIDAKLTEVLDWAQAKLDSNQEPPWAWDQYTKLVATITSILEGRAATISMEDSLLLAARQDNEHPPHSRIVSIETVRLRRGLADPILPM